jgi:hypothetical protein
MIAAMPWEEDGGGDRRMVRRRKFVSMLADAGTQVHFEDAVARHNDTLGGPRAICLIEVPCFGGFIDVMASQLQTQRSLEPICGIGAELGAGTCIELRRLCEHKHN